MKKIHFILIASVIVLALAGFYFARKNKKTIINNPQSMAEDKPSVNNEEVAKEGVAPENKNGSAPEPVKAAENNNDKIESENNPGAVSEKESEKREVSGIKNKLVSWGYQKASGRKIDTIIIHSTYNALGGDQFGLAKIIDIYKSYGVAPHYIIDRAGQIYRLVEEKNIAYHAGESKVPDGRSDVNDFSIGIEMINSKTERCTAAQYSALKSLVADIKERYKIKYTLGHDQIAPGRKDDPWNFDWSGIK